MNRSMQFLAAAVLLGLVVAAGCFYFFFSGDPGRATIPDRQVVEEILSAYDEAGHYEPLQITYPLDGTLFPPEIVPPKFRWKDSSRKTDVWLVAFEFRNAGRMNFIFLTERSQWTPSPAEWKTIQQHSSEAEATVTVLGAKRAHPSSVVSAGRISIGTSRDEVGAPLFFREVNLPFIEAVKDPTRIRWRFGSISSPEPPPVVLENLPVCGNCHSFCEDGSVLGMDVDYANSKGSYVITRVAKEMVLTGEDVITWNDYRREDGEQTFGLLSQVSPDGRYVVSTVKDKSVFVPRPDLAFSQLFFPLKGILVVYDRQEQAFRPLPGADDQEFVQSNPSWSPDGKYLVFARSKAYDLKDTQGKGKVLLRPEECREFVQDGKPFRFDLYRIPFNGGRGGKAEPLEGASQDGMSNYFARYSPDGKWIVFCKAKSYMLLQPDSELYIIPAEGGTARRLRCNTARMNSWHSWSPNGKWLVFSSKAESAYTQLCLTHIDEQGRSTPPVLLSHLTASDRAANIPEFVNAPPSAIRRIREQFLDDYSFVRAGNQFLRSGEIDDAVRNYEKALELNPDNAEAHQRLGVLLYQVKRMPREGFEHTRTAVRLDPGNARAQYDLGMAYLQQKNPQQAVAQLSVALKLMPDGLDQQYNAVDLRYNLGRALVSCGKQEEGIARLREAVRIAPNCAKAHYYLALLSSNQGNLDDTLKHYSAAVRAQPRIDTSAVLHDNLGVAYAKAGRFREALSSAQRALQLAQAAGNQQRAQIVLQRLQTYERLLGRPQPGLP